MSGTARHEFYERHNEEGILAEVRLAIRMPSGRIITGQIDRYLPAHHRIEDYKFKTEDHAPFNKAPLNYVAQQNIYRYMLMQGCIIYETGEIIPPQEEITELVLYASNHKDWLEVRCPIWPFERVEWYIETMLDFFDATHDPNYLPPRVHANPKTDRFCQNYCPLVNYCVAAGGDEVRDVLVEAATR